MVTIRLFRTGTRKRPSYRVIAIDSRSARQSRPLEVLGTYAPRGVGGVTHIDTDKYDAWVSKGAQPSDTVRSLVRRQRRAASQVVTEVAAEPVVEVAAEPQVEAAAEPVAEAATEPEVEAAAEPEAEAAAEPAAEAAAGAGDTPAPEAAEGAEAVPEEKAK